MGERLNGIQEVDGSIPFSSTLGRRKPIGFRLQLCAPGMARSAVTGAVNREAKANREVTWRWKSYRGPWWREPLAEQQLRHREVSWEGSCKQIPGPRNTNRIRGVRRAGKGAK